MLSNELDLMGRLDQALDYICMLLSEKDEESLASWSNAVKFLNDNNHEFPPIYE